MQIRTATHSDCKAIAELHAASWRTTYRDALSEEYLAGDVVTERWNLWQARLAEPAERQHVLVAEQCGQLLGFACVYGDENYESGSYLNNIHVAQAAQGVGVGASLLHATAELCALAYVREGLYLWVLQSNTKAQGFYACYGARNTGTDIWHAPGGTVAPLFRFSWESVVALRNVTANPSIERTSPGKPGAASHLKR